MDYQAYAGVVPRHDRAPRRLGRARQDRGRRRARARSSRPGGSVGRFESDALVASSAFPSVDIGYDGHNKKSTLLGLAPPDTIAYAEVHDVGAALTALLDRVPGAARGQAGRSTRSTRSLGRPRRGLRLVGRHRARRRRRTPTARSAAASSSSPTDAAAAKTASSTTLRGLLALGGGQRRDQRSGRGPHGDATITIVDFSGVRGGRRADAAARLQARARVGVTTRTSSSSATASDFVEAVLDAGPGPSLADDARVPGARRSASAPRTSASRSSTSPRIRELSSRSPKAQMPADKWAEYTKEIQPYLEPFDAVDRRASTRTATSTGSSGVTVH